jgi:hypothetical protein
MRSVLLLLAGCAAGLLIGSPPGQSQPVSANPVLPLEEMRYCGPPERDENNRIKRRSDVIRSFRDAHPCPVTGEHRGSCPGWAIDHVIPLACGGCDAVSNLQWLPNELKSAAGTIAKDRWERKIYCVPFEAVGF